MQGPQYLITFLSNPSLVSSEACTMNSRNIPPAIIFFGPDGSAKTTQAALLVNEIQRRGMKTKKIWLRPPHTLAYAISIITMRFLKLDDGYELRSKYGPNRIFR